MTHLNTKKQGIISPKRLKKSALGRFYSFLILQSSIGNFSRGSVEINCTFLVHFLVRGKSAYLCSLHQTAALFHLLWIFWYSGWTFSCIFLLTDSPRKSKNFSLLSPSSCSHEKGTWWGGFSLILVFNNIIPLCVALLSGTHSILRCSQGMLCSQGCSAQWPCWFLLLNLPSVFFFICCRAYLYQLLVLEPHSLFKGSFFFSMDFLQQFLHSPIKMLRRKIPELGDTQQHLLSPAPTSLGLGWILSQHYISSLRFHLSYKGE